MGFLRININHLGIILISLFLTTACSEKDKLKAVMNSYVGYNIESVSAQLGYPLSKIEEASFTIYRYGFSKLVYTSNGLSNSNTGHYEQYRCSIEFKVDKKNIIHSYDYSGNGCYSYAKKKYVNPKYILDLPTNVTEFYGFEYKKISKGLKIESVDERSKAFEAGLRKNQIIQRLNGQDITGLPIEFAVDIISKHKKLKLEILDKKQINNIDIEITKIKTLELYKPKINKFLGF
jgi:hypothetical protein